MQQVYRLSQLHCSSIVSVLKSLSGMAMSISAASCGELRHRSTMNSWHLNSWHLRYEGSSLPLPAAAAATDSWIACDGVLCSTCSSVTLVSENLKAEFPDYSVQLWDVELTWSKRKNKSNFVEFTPQPKGDAVWLLPGFGPQTNQLHIKQL